MFLRIGKIVSFIWPLLLLAGCGKATEKFNPIPFDPYVVSDSSNAIQLSTGVKIYMIEEGPGARPVLNSQVCIHYLGMLKDGKKIDSSWERGTPLCFVIGEKQVISGLEEAITSIRLGSKAVVFIPAEMGYGAGETPSNIPPNSALIFHVDLLGNF